jgi:hypothetical protein
MCISGVALLGFIFVYQTKLVLKEYSTLFKSLYQLHSLYSVEWRWLWTKSKRILWKKAVLVYLDILTEHLTGWNGKNHEGSRYRQYLDELWDRISPDMKGRANLYTVMFVCYNHYSSGIVSNHDTLTSLRKAGEVSQYITALKCVIVSNFKFNYIKWPSKHTKLHKKSNDSRKVSIRPRHSSGG